MTTTKTRVQRVKEQAIRNIEFTQTKEKDQDRDICELCGK